ncbi:MAG TPA: serine hydrolase domain-containing protein [Acidimicrobiia bacterium]|nr:serine hydrolase domain-containing protein [Acidimicrobiia bacterium]
MDLQRDTIATAVEEARRQDRLFAAGIALMVNGKVQLRTTAGAHDLTPFEIGSITKLLTTTLAIRTGIDLDAPVEDLVSGFFFGDRRGARVTLRHLLTHSSGLPAAGRDWGPADPEALSRFVMTDLANHRFHAGPGEVGCYSSTAISLVGLVLQEITGSRFPDLFRSQVLEPAGMTGSGFPSEIDPGRVSWPHSRVGGTWQPVLRLADNPAVYPSGFLLATLDDMAHLALTVLEGGLIGGVDGLIATTVPRWIDHTRSPHGRASAAYGLGSFTGDWSGQTVIRHGGGQLTSNCSVDFFPETDSAVVLLTNGADDATFMELLSLCYQVVAGPPDEMSPLVMQVPDPSRQQAAVGTFLDVDSGSMLTIGATEENRLFIDREGGRTRLDYVGDHRWIASGRGDETPIGIPWDGDPAAHVFVWGNPHVRIDLPDVEVKTDGGRLCGVYADSFWDHPESRLVVDGSGGELVVTGEGFVSAARPIGPLRLISDHGLLEFEENGTGMVLGNATRYVRIADR